MITMMLQVLLPQGVIERTLRLMMALLLGMSTQLAKKRMAQQLLLVAKNRTRTPLSMKLPVLSTMVYHGPTLVRMMGRKRQKLQWFPLLLIRLLG